MSRFLLRLVPSIALLLSASLHAQEPPPSTVSVAPAVSERFAPVLWTPAGVVSRSDARVAGEQDGRVVFVAEVGDTVARGGVLARLDERLLALRVAELESELARTDAQLDHARRQEQRLAQLAEQATVSGAALDEARAQRAVLEQERRRGDLQLQTARHRLGNAVVRAPFAGTVVERFTEVGEYVGAGSPVVRLVDTAQVEAQARAPVTMAGHVRAGMRVRVRHGGSETMQTVRAVVPVGDASSRQFELRIALEGSGWAVGSALDVGLPSEPPRDVVAVPRDALLLRPDATYVIRINDEAIAERIAVRTGGAQGELVEVIGDVAAGDRLVVRGGERLAPGARVRIEDRPVVARSVAAEPRG